MDAHQHYEGIRKCQQDSLGDAIMITAKTAAILKTWNYIYTRDCCPLMTENLKILGQRQNPLSIQGSIVCRDKYIARISNGLNYDDFRITRDCVI
jgi:hypothetical protein